MKIVLAGNHNPYFFNSVQCREKAFRELGHDVIFFDIRGFWLPGRLRKAWPALHAWDWKRNCKALEILVQKEKPDILIVIGGGILSGTIRNISALGVRTILWTTDPPTDSSWLIDPAPFFDDIFCSGTEAIEILKNIRTKKSPRWLPFACDSDIHCSPEVISEEDRKRYERDIAFVGSYYPNRKEFFEGLADLDIGIFGPFWDKVGVASPLWPKVYSRRLNYDEWTKIYALSDIVLIVHYQDGHTPCYQASPKLFEALSCGSFVMCDDQKDARTLFEDGEHLVFFKDCQDLRQKIKYYLDRPEERRRIARAGHEEVLARHTYKQRAVDLLRESRLG